MRSKSGKYVINFFMNKNVKNLKSTYKHVNHFVIIATFKVFSNWRVKFKLRN